MSKDLWAEDFEVYPFQPQASTNPALLAKVTRNPLNFFVAEKLPSDCGIMCLHAFHAPAVCFYDSGGFRRPIKEYLRVQKNLGPELKEQILSLIDTPSIYHGRECSEEPGMFLASLTQGQANIGGELFPPIEPILLDCGFKPLVTAKNGNSRNDIRLYGRVLNKSVYEWKTQDELLEV